MFRKANKLAREFTLPVVTSRLSVNGQCTAQIGALVLLNKDGWIATCFHVVQAVVAILQGDADYRAFELQRDAINNDPNLSAQEKKTRYKSLRKFGQEDVRRGSVLWGFQGLTITTWNCLPAGDIAVGQLNSFTPHPGQTYPIFKDPKNEFEPGASLCKLGYPFHGITPIWNEAANGFELPPGAYPVPIFPIEGIFTRTAEVAPPANQTWPAPVKFIETSTVGIPGQSGGPIFDPEGSIWGIQSHVRALPLGLDVPMNTDNPNGKKISQYLNFGYGTHAETVLALCDKFGVQVQRK